MRALVLALMANGKSRIHNYLKSPDTNSMIEALRKLGAKVAVSETTLEIQGTRAWKDARINAGNSGQVYRFIGALAALSNTVTQITGDQSICTNRPIQPLIDALKEGGAHVEFPPLQIQGPLKPGTFHIQGEDSQPVSALIMATAFLSGPSHIYVSNPGEKPWIELTLHWLKKFKIDVVNENFEHFIVPGKASIQGFETTIPGDWSTAAYPIAASLITGKEIFLQNLDSNDVQGDKQIVDALKQMGANIENLRVKKSSLRGIKIDVNNFIDALPILAVLGCYATGKTELVNGKIARFKESDRIHAIATELKKMGANIEETEDGLIIFQSSLKGAHLHSHKDHRIAMALHVAALGAKGKTTIDDTDCIGKSCPNFYDLIRF